MTLIITINLILSAIVFAGIMTLISRTILTSRPAAAAAPARGDRPRERSFERRGLGARFELDPRT
jgi:hypothetical protein